MRTPSPITQTTQEVTEAMEAVEVWDGDETRRQLLPRASDDLWDLAEDVGRLLESCDDLDLTPACCDLLLALDDAITSALHTAH